MEPTPEPITPRDAILSVLTSAGGPIGAATLRLRVERLLPPDPWQAWPNPDGALYDQLDLLLGEGLVRFQAGYGWELVPESGGGHG